MVWKLSVSSLCWGLNLNAFYLCGWSSSRASCSGPLHQWWEILNDSFLLLENPKGLRNQSVHSWVVLSEPTVHLQMKKSFSPGRRYSGYFKSLPCKTRFIRDHLLVLPHKGSKEYFKNFFKFTSICWLILKRLDKYKSLKNYSKTNLKIMLYFLTSNEI